MPSSTTEEKNWVLNEIKKETGSKKNRKTGKTEWYGISPKELEQRAIDGRKPLGNVTGIPGRDKVRQIVKDLTVEGKIRYQKSQGRKQSMLIALELDQRMQEERNWLYLYYLKILREVDDIAMKAKLRAFNEKDFFRYVRIRNELFSFPSVVYHSNLKSSDLVKSNLASDILDQIKTKIDSLKKIEKIQQKHFTNLDKILEAINQFSELNYELYYFLSSDKSIKTKKRFEGLFRSRRNEIESFIKTGKRNHAR